MSIARTARLRELISRAERIVALQSDPLTFSPMLVAETEDRFPSIFLSDGLTGRVYSMTRAEFEDLQRKREEAGTGPAVLIVLANCSEVTGYMKRRAKTVA